MVVAVGSSGLILVAVIVVIMAGVIYGYYTRGGSGIETRAAGSRRPPRPPG